METSARTGLNVDLAFMAVARFVKFVSGSNLPLLNGNGDDVI